jgi:hypothetical protein
VSTTDIDTGTPTGGDAGTGPGSGRGAGAAERAEGYLDEVRRHLADLGDDERDDLLDDLTAHVHQVAAGDCRPLDDVLGTPSAFAAELPATAGLAPAAPSSALAHRADRADRQLSAALTAVQDHRWTRAVVAFLPELRPAWWVARGWLLVYGFCLIGAEPDLRGAFPFPEILGSALLGAFAGIAASVASVRLARRRPASGWRHVVNALAIAAALLLLVRADDLDRPDMITYADDVYATPQPPDHQLAHPDGSAITNIYAYDAEGEPLGGVLLYDQHGRPIELGEAVDPMTGLPLEHDAVLDELGGPVGNLYPVDQYTVTWSADGSTQSRVPVPRPEVVVPSLAPAPAPDAPATDTTEPTGTDGTAGGAPSTTAASGSSPPTTAEGS